jgi:large conductance mechanosensitive channel
MRESELPVEPATKECPHCCSAVPLKATRCPHCTSELA